MSKTSDLSFSHVDGIGNRGWRDGVIPVLSASAFTQLVTAFMARRGRYKLARPVARQAPFISDRRCAGPALQRAHGMIKWG